MRARTPMRRMLALSDWLQPLTARPAAKRYRMRGALRQGRLRQQPQGHEPAPRGSTKRASTPSRAARNRLSARIS